jgi:hypothetical protein
MWLSFLSYSKGLKDEQPTIRNLREWWLNKVTIMYHMRNDLCKLAVLLKTVMEYVKIKIFCRLLEKIAEMINNGNSTRICGLEEGITSSLTNGSFDYTLQ